VDPGIATIIGAVIGASASISITLIMARTPKQSVHKILISYPTASVKDSWFLRAFRAVCWGLVGVMAFAGMSLISMTAILWMDSTTGTRDQKLFTIIFLLSSALLFVAARWLSNRIKQPDTDVEDSS
jgi:hypothetical protein